MSEGAVTTEWYVYQKDWEHVRAELIQEALVTVNVNGEELVTLMATPREQKFLALGLLRNERLIDGLREVDHVHVSDDGCCVDVWLKRDFTPPEKRIITSGCGGGVTFGDPSNGIAPLETEMQIAPDTVAQMFAQLHFPGSLHSRARGVHAAGLADGKTLLVRTEDIGRHNTIDKLLGKCMLNGIETRERILLVTGRVSAEMLRKGAEMGCPIVASRNSPTFMSLTMARAWNITLIGYVQRDSMRVYAHPQRLGFVEHARKG